MTSRESSMSPWIRTDGPRKKNLRLESLDARRMLAGTPELVKDINTVAGSNPREILQVGSAISSLPMTVILAMSCGRAIARKQGMVKWLPELKHSTPFDVNGNLFLTADDGIHGREVWGLRPDSIAGDLDGDYDGDADVDQADCLVWETTFGQILVPGTGADGNLDGVIDGTDYTTWQDSRNQTAALSWRQPAELVASAGDGPDVYGECGHHATFPATNPEVTQPNAVGLGQLINCFSESALIAWSSMRLDPTSVTDEVLRGGWASQKPCRSLISKKAAAREHRPGARPARRTVGTEEISGVRS